MNTFKKRITTCPSFVAAVTKHGDQWILGMPVQMWTHEQTMDWREAIHMRLYEQGLLPRVID